MGRMDSRGRFRRKDGRRLGRGELCVGRGWVPSVKPSVRPDAIVPMRGVRCGSCGDWLRRSGGRGPAKAAGILALFSDFVLAAEPAVPSPRETRACSPCNAVSSTVRSALRHVLPQQLGHERRHQSRSSSRAGLTNASSRTYRFKGFRVSALKVQRWSGNGEFS